MHLGVATVASMMRAKSAVGGACNDLDAHRVII